MLLLGEEAVVKKFGLLLVGLEQGEGAHESGLRCEGEALEDEGIHFIDYN